VSPDGALIVKVAEVVALSTIPLFCAMARSAALLLIVKGPLYSGELVVGLAPFRVYRIVAPAVVVVSVTETGAPKVPPAGVMTGAATVDGG
jgi:hypothetical protein